MDGVNPEVDPIWTWGSLAQRKLVDILTERNLGHITCQFSAFFYHIHFTIYFSIIRLRLFLMRKLRGTRPSLFFNMRWSRFFSVVSITWSCRCILLYFLWNMGAATEVEGAKRSARTDVILTELNIAWCPASGWRRRGTDENGSRKLDQFGLGCQWECPVFA
jgi:hypothetical protein